MYKLLTYWFIGVLWAANAALKNSNKVINRFMEMGKRVLYVTNNSMLTREDVVSKAVDLGFSAKKVSQTSFFG